MMRSFDLSHHRRANVWLDESLPAEFTATSVVTRLITPKKTIVPSSRTAGVELYIPRGPRISYGVLGAELIEADVDGLEINVSVNKTGFPFRPSLAAMSDEVKIGLLEEYATAVINGAVKVAETIGAPTNATLRFRWAAHGIVGSSQSIFENASTVVLQLLMLTKSAPDDQLRALFD